MHQCLHDRMICGIHVRVHGKIALSAAVERPVAVWGDDPVVPLEVLEAHVQLLDLTTLCVRRPRFIERMRAWALCGLLPLAATTGYVPLCPVPVMMRCPLALCRSYPILALEEAH